eukprot:NODE_148_length_15570_cov_0.950100.p6 type:complete len:493 gc:universal NODE_148_length_15570_cov_0.950100:1653-3131(+)
MLLPLIYSKKYIVTTSEKGAFHASSLATFTMGDHHGYVADLSDDQIESLRNDKRVLSIEEDGIMKTMEVQKDVPWGLARISHRETDSTEYVYPTNAGEGVTVYIVDTGINAEHEEFEGRATAGQDFTEDQDGIDGNGHGTHCAGTIGGKNYGIAKKAHLVGVKVLSKAGYGSTSGVIQGIEWAYKHHKSRGENAKSVINMSLGGGKSIALNRAVEAAVKAGVVVSVAAGNEDNDACNSSPASSEAAITVGATTSHDQRAWFSNWGTCVDILAPGYKIKSAWIGSKTATNIISGTSMASPHVAGASAVYLSDNEEVKLNPEMVRQILIRMSTKNIIKGLPTTKKPDSDWPFPFPQSPNHGSRGETPNRLLFHPEQNVMVKVPEHSVQNTYPPNYQLVRYGFSIFNHGSSKKDPHFHHPSLGFLHHIIRWLGHHHKHHGHPPHRGNPPHDHPGQDEINFGSEAPSPSKMNVRMKFMSKSRDNRTFKNLWGVLFD